MSSQAQVIKTTLPNPPPSVPALLANVHEALAELKALLKEQGTKEATFETVKLVQNNRQGRQMMKSFFKKRGVIVKFAQGEGADADGGE